VLVAAHAFEILVMLLAGVVLAARVRRDRPLPWALFGAGMLAFVFAEVAQIGASNLIASLQAEQLVPVPTRESASRVSFVLIGLFTALTLEPLRWFVLSRYTPGYRSHRAALLVGAGAGAMEGILMGAVVLFMMVLALVFHDETLESLTAAGLSGGTAVKVGLRVVAWWDSSPYGALLAAAEAVARLALQVGSTCVVMLGVRRRAPRWLALAVLVTALFEAASAWAMDPSSGVSEGLASGVVFAALPLGLGMVGFARSAAARDGALEEPTGSNGAVGEGDAAA
jgi:uncharacterized membrane protein YhfC